MEEEISVYREYRIPNFRERETGEGIDQMAEKGCLVLDRAEDKRLVRLGDRKDTHLQRQTREERSACFEGNRDTGDGRRTVLVDPPPALHPWIATIVSFFLTMPSSSPRESPYRIRLSTSTCHPSSEVGLGAS